MTKQYLNVHIPLDTCDFEEAVLLRGSAVSTIAEEILSMFELDTKTIAVPAGRDALLSRREVWQMDVDPRIDRTLSGMMNLFGDKRR